MAFFFPEWISDYADAVADPEALRVEVDTFMEAYDKKIAEVGAPRATKGHLEEGHGTVWWPQGGWGRLALSLGGIRAPFCLGCRGPPGWVKQTKGPRGGREVALAPLPPTVLGPALCRGVKGDNGGQRSGQDAVRGPRQPQDLVPCRRRPRPRRRKGSPMRRAG